jgi:hypothetical protein
MMPAVGSVLGVPPYNSLDDAIIASQSLCIREVGQNGSWLAQKGKLLMLLGLRQSGHNPFTSTQRSTLPCVTPRSG